MIRYIQTIRLLIGRAVTDDYWSIESIIKQPNRLQLEGLLEPHTIKAFKSKDCIGFSSYSSST